MVLAVGCEVIDLQKNAPVAQLVEARVLTRCDEAHRVRAARRRQDADWKAAPGMELWNEFKNAPVAQLDRVPGYELGGREFESLRARQIQGRVPWHPFAL